MKIKIGLIGANGRMGKAIGNIYPIIPIQHNDKKNADRCDVLIDVSSASSLQENLSYKKPIVVGTTGHLDFSPIEEYSKTYPIFWAPNFSLGIALLKKMTQELFQTFPADIDIIETHHTKKKDLPSGTALLLAKELPKANIHSIRSGEIIGEHTIIFNTPEERLTLTHTAHSREAFAKGAIAAAKHLHLKPKGLYTMENLFPARI